MGDFNRHTAILGGLQINYVSKGEGIPMIFLHNGGGFWQTWEKQLTYFSANYKVYAIDWPGCGDSEYAGIPLVLDITAKVLKEFIDHIHVSTFYLVGNCIGASCALDYAIQFPDKVIKLVLMNICPGDLLLPTFVNKKHITSLQHKPKTRKLYSRLLRVFFPGILTRFYFPRILFGKSIRSADPMFKKYRQKQKEENQIRTRYDLVFFAFSYNIDRIIRDKIVPKHLLIWGSENKVASLEKYGYHHKSLLQPEAFHVILNAGHLCQYESPDEVTKIIEDYIYA